VHGTGDDNVHPQNTMILARELVDAGRPFEMAIYPGQKHGFGKGERRHFVEAMTRFFDRELGGGGTLRAEPAPAAFRRPSGAG
jgi:dipeptidyl-peptidase-4